MKTSECSIFLCTFANAIGEISLHLYISFCDQMDSKDVLVSINCLVYNHEPFLRKCLDGFLMQETTFAFEVIVHDDASTDGSTDIIREYAKSFPDIIKPMYEEENQFSENGAFALEKRMFQASSPTSKYIALCEGDDYWADPHKLQRQFEALEKYPACSFCSTGFRIVKKDGNNEDVTIYDNGSDVSFYGIESWTKKWVHQPLTLFIRKDVYDFCMEELSKYYRPKDAHVIYYLFKKGRCVYIPCCMGVYNESGLGVWSSKSYSQQIAMNLKVRRDLYKNNGNDPDVYPPYMLYIFTNLKNLDTKNHLQLLGEGMREATSWKDRMKLMKSYLVFVKHRILCCICH